MLMWCNGSTPTSVGGKSSILFMGTSMALIVLILGVIGSLLMGASFLFLGEEDNSIGKDLLQTGAILCLPALITIIGLWLGGGSL